MIEQSVSSLAFVGLLVCAGFLVFFLVREILNQARKHREYRRKLNEAFNRYVTRRANEAFNRYVTRIDSK